MRIRPILRWLACLAAALGAAIAVADEIFESPTYTGAKTTIRYALWGGAGEVTYGRQICRMFVARHPEIRVDLGIYPWGQYWAKIQTQMASGLAPDVMSFYSGSYGVWVARGALRPIDDLVAESKLDLSAYHRVSIKNLRWGGHLYALPTELAMWVLVYSKDRLEESGIPQSEWPQPDRPMKWDAFRDLARRLTLRNPDGTFAQYGMSAGQNWDEIMTSANGGFVLDRQVDPTRSTALHNEPLATALVQMFQSQYAERFVLGQVPLTTGAFAASTDTLLLSPRFAMGTTGPWALPQLKDGGVRFGISPMPVGGKPAQIVSVNSLGIYAHSLHPREAWEMIKFVASEPVQRIYGRQLKGIPALRAASDSLIHNDFHIPGLEAYLHDLDTAFPTITAGNTYVVSARDKWIAKLEQDLDTEYDARLAKLPRTNGVIAKRDYDAFVTGMKAAVDKTVRASLPELDAALGDAFRQSEPVHPSAFVRGPLPVIACIALVLLVTLYIRAVRKNQATPASGGMKRGNLAGYAFIAPWLFGFVCFVFGPILAAVFLSFTDWNMIRAPQWVGATHYVGMPGDKNFLIGLKNTFMYAAFVIPISLVGGLVTAGLLTTKIRGANLFKAIIYFPALFTGAEAAVLWVNMLNKEHGVVNQVLSWVGIAPINWMDEGHAFFSVVLMNVFWIGGAMIIYYAGMKQIPAALYEAAELDGASMAKRFLRITIPMLSPVILFMVVMTTIGAFQVFTPALFFASSSSAIGSPGDSLRFYSVNIYDQAFNNLRMGEACSYAIVLFLLIFLITMVQMRLARRFVYSEGGE